MAIVDQIERLTSAANRIKTKTAALGLNKVSTDGGGVISSSDKLDVQARAHRPFKVIRNLSKETSQFQQQMYIEQVHQNPQVQHQEMMEIFIW